MGVAHCRAMLRSSLRDWRTLHILRRESRAREMKVRRQALWALVVRTSSSRDQRRALAIAAYFHLRTLRRRAVGRWKDEAFRSQYFRLQVRLMRLRQIGGVRLRLVHHWQSDDAAIFHAERLTRRGLRSWRAEAALSAVIR
jgi:hypothetical protein